MNFTRKTTLNILLQKHHEMIEAESINDFAYHLMGYTTWLHCY